MNNYSQKQYGMATMLMSVILLVSIGLISVYGAQVSVMEQRISANQYRAKQAFEAAQAGLDNVIYNLDMSIVNGAICTGVAGAGAGVCNGLDGGTGTGTQANFVNANALFTLTPTNAQNVGDFDLSFTQRGGSNLIDFTLNGYAGDNAIANNNPNQVIQQSVIKVPILNATPPAALIARSAITVDTGVTITNNDSLGLSWSGTATTVNGATLNTIPNGGYYENDAGLNGLPLGDDTVNPVVPDSFFENFFAESRVNLRNRAGVLACAAGCNSADLQALVDAGNNIIWVDAQGQTLTLDGGSVFGTLAGPLLLIVNGTLTMNNATFVGLIFTMQDFDVAGSTGTITGTLITEGNVLAPLPAAALNLTYSQAVFTNINTSMALFTRVAGSWRDF